VWRAGAPAVDFIAPDIYFTPLILEHQGRGTMAGLLQEHPDNRAPQQLRLGGWVLNASFERGSTATRPTRVDTCGSCRAGSRFSGSSCTAIDEWLAVSQGPLADRKGGAARLLIYWFAGE
jgi:hypothetical protein